MDKDKIIRLLKQFLAGDIDEWTFDDFISSPIEGYLDVYRLEIAKLPNIYPSKSENHYCNEQGISRIVEILEELEGAK